MKTIKTNPISITSEDLGQKQWTVIEDEATNYQFDKLTRCILQRSKQDESTLARQSDF